jgi:hypothetical protein
MGADTGPPIARISLAAQATAASALSCAWSQIQSVTTGRRQSSPQQIARDTGGGWWR